VSGWTCARSAFGVTTKKAVGNSFSDSLIEIQLKSGYGFFGVAVALAAGKKKSILSADRMLSILILVIFYN